MNEFKRMKFEKRNAM